MKCDWVYQKKKKKRNAFSNGDDDEMGMFIIMN
jgi:hypothetical protein